MATKKSLMTKIGDAVEAAKDKAQDEDRMPGPRDIKVLKYGRPGQRPEVKQLRVLGNQRLTSGGQIKRAKPKKSS